MRGKLIVQWMIKKRYKQSNNKNTIESESINKMVKLINKSLRRMRLLLAISIIGDPFFDKIKKFKAEIFIMRSAYFVCAMRVELKIRNAIMFTVLVKWMSIECVTAKIINDHKGSECVCVCMCHHQLIYVPFEMRISFHNKHIAHSEYIHTEAGIQ